MAAAEVSSCSISRIDKFSRRCKHASRYSLPGSVSGSKQSYQQAMKAYAQTLQAVSVPKFAIVREVPATFANCVTIEAPSSAIDVEMARKQHAEYVQALQGLVGEVIVVPADDLYPDCPFVEDTAVVFGGRAFITKPGAVSRRGEEEAVKKLLIDIGLQISSEAKSSSRIDGGDVLCLQNHIFVGLSRRTNMEGAEALARAFPEASVVPLPFHPASSLHLKSVLSWAGGNTIVVEDNKESMALFESIQEILPSLESKVLKDKGAANCVFVGGRVLFPSAYSSESNKVYESLLSVQPLGLNISEFHKADGGLTCLSILVN